jgi:hypothetical protein
VFEDPDATLPASALKEGSPGHEILTGDAVGLGREDDEDRETSQRRAGRRRVHKPVLWALPHIRVDLTIE